MNISNYYSEFKNCRQNEEPACENICPFHLDIFDFQDKISRHKYDRAYKTYRNAVGFPHIVSALCPEYCSEVCPRKDLDGAVRLNLLEKTCVAKTVKKDPISYNLPPKKGKVGIIGAGISGLACALRLLEKRYEVTVFEKEKVIGGQLKDLLPKEVYMKDIERQFGKLKYSLESNREIKNLAELEDYGFDVIVVATGKGGIDFGLSEIKEDDFCQNKNTMDPDGRDVIITGVGGLTGRDVIMSMANGLEIAGACELYLVGGKFEYPKPRTKSKVVPDMDKFIPAEPVNPSDNGIFTDEETESEASRCIRCQCDACMTYCDMVEFHNQWPVSMREDVSRTVAPSESMVHKTPSIRLINTCTQCGVFEEMCPADIKLGEMMLEARKMLHKQNKMPPAFHGFWLDDMEHSNSNLSKICKKAPESVKCEYAFFPGCNLGAADPAYVEKPYSWLLDNFDDIGLLLRCCGVPADWSGNEEVHRKYIQSLKDDWTGLGKPTLITACPSCTGQIKKYLPEINLISIYELMEKYDKWPDNRSLSFEKMNDFALFDPCSARNDENLKKAVRLAANNVDFPVTELPNRDRHGCCGFGGNVEIANPVYADFIADKRMALSEAPYLTYCINCRDIFLNREKQVLHMFDVLFDIDNSDGKAPGLSERRSNRYELKKNMLKNIWGEDMTKKKEYPFIIETNDEMKNKLDNLKLVEDDIREVLDKSLKLNRRTYDKEKDEYICYAKLNYITCWVRYKEAGSRNNKHVYEILNVYTHRMFIDLEAVWNGQKVDTDM